MQVLNYILVGKSVVLREQFGKIFHFILPSHLSLVHRRFPFSMNYGVLIFCGRKII